MAVIMVVKGWFCSCMHLFI